MGGWELGRAVPYECPLPGLQASLRYAWASRQDGSPSRAGLWCTGSEGWLGVGEVFPSLAFGLRCAPGFAALRRDETP